MNVNFATCEPNKALEYIQKVLPGKDVTKEMIPKTLSLVERDVLRVQDPLMYGSQIGVIAGNKYSEEYANEIQNAITTELNPLMK